MSTDTRTDAEKFCDRFGYDDGMTQTRTAALDDQLPPERIWMTDDLRDRSEASEIRRPVIVRPDGPESHQIDAWEFPDGSGIVFAGDHWDLFDRSGRTEEWGVVRDR